jgi:hypothetical protein
MKRAILLTSLLATTVLAAACGSGDGEGDGVCTLIGCEDGLTIEFELTEPGAYTFDLVADGEPITCTGALPLPPCSSAGGATCSESGVSIGESGCALGSSSHSLLNLSFSGSTPAKVELTIKRDGAEVAQQSFTPEYKTFTPNGPGCEPTCTNAEVSLALP